MSSTCHIVTAAVVGTTNDDQFHLGSVPRKRQMPVVFVANIVAVVVVVGVAAAALLDSELGQSTSMLEYIYIAM